MNGGKRIIHVTVMADRQTSKRTFEVESVLVGRNVDCMVPLTHHDVSRRHLMLTVRGTDLWIEDLGSSNGTFINGVRLAPKTPQMLRASDKVKVGANTGIQLMAEVENPKPVEPPEPESVLPPDDLEYANTIIFPTQARNASTTQMPASQAHEVKPAPSIAGNGSQVNVPRVETDPVVTLPSQPSPAVVDPMISEMKQKAVQQAKREAAEIIRTAKIEAEFKVQDIFERAQKTQKEAEETYSRKMHDASELAEEMRAEAQREAEDLLAGTRQVCADIRSKTDLSVTELRSETRRDCDQMLREMETQVRQARESRLKELESNLARREFEVIDEVKKRMAVVEREQQERLQSTVNAHLERMKIERSEHERVIQDSRDAHQLRLHAEIENQKTRLVQEANEHVRALTVERQTQESLMTEKWAQHQEKILVESREHQERLRTELESHQARMAEEREKHDHALKMEWDAHVERLKRERLENEKEIQNERKQHNLRFQAESENQHSRLAQESAEHVRSLTLERETQESLLSEKLTQHHQKIFVESQEHEKRISDEARASSELIGRETREHVERIEREIRAHVERIGGESREHSDRLEKELAAHCLRVQTESESLDRHLKAEKIRFETETIELRETHGNLLAKTGNLSMVLIEQEESLGALERKKVEIQKVLEELTLRTHEGEAKSTALQSDIKKCQGEISNSKRDLESINHSYKNIVDKKADAERQFDADISNLRAKFEKEKTRLEREEQEHLLYLKQDTGKRVQEAEREMLSEIARKKSSFVQEILLFLEKSSGVISSHASDWRAESKDIGTKLSEQLEGQLFAMQIDGVAPQKMNINARRRREQIVHVGIGAFMGIVLVFGATFAMQQMYGPSPLDRAVASETAARVKDREVRKFNPPRDPELRDNYVDAVIYTDGYTQITTSDEYYQKWSLALAKHLLKLWKVDEDSSLQVASIANALVKSLADRKEKINPDFVQDALKKMKDSESEAIERMVSILGSEVRFESVKKFERKFFLDYRDHQGQEAPPAPPETPVSQ